VINCLNYETLTNGDQTDRAFALVDETHHIEDNLRFWNWEQIRLLEMIKIVRAIPKPVGSYIQKVAGQSAGSEAGGIGSLFDDAVSLSSQWCYNGMRHREDNDWKQLYTNSCNPVSPFLMEKLFNKSTQPPTTHMTQEEFLKNLGLISQAALQLHLNTPKKVERRRRAVTANPKYTSNGFVEISQIVSIHTICQILSILCGARVDCAY